MTCKWKVFCKQGDTCVAHEGYDVLKCTAFKDKEEPLTNEEYIRTCSTEDLAALIYQDRWTQSDGWYEQTGHTVEDVKKWLKEKHHE